MEMRVHNPRSSINLELLFKLLIREKKRVIFFLMAVGLPMGFE